MRRQNVYVVTHSEYWPTKTKLIFKLVSEKYEHIQLEKIFILERRIATLFTDFRCWRIKTERIIDQNNNAFGHEISLFYNVVIVASYSDKFTGKMWGRFTPIRKLMCSTVAVQFALC